MSLAIGFKWLEGSWLHREMSELVCAVVAKVSAVLSTTSFGQRRLCGKDQRCLFFDSPCVNRSDVLILWVEISLDLLSVLPNLSQIFRAQRDTEMNTMLSEVSQRPTLQGIVHVSPLLRNAQP